MLSDSTSLNLGLSPLGTGMENGLNVSPLQIPEENNVQLGVSTISEVAAPEDRSVGSSMAEVNDGVTEDSVGVNDGISAKIIDQSQSENSMAPIANEEKVENQQVENLSGVVGEVDGVESLMVTELPEGPNMDPSPSLYINNGVEEKNVAKAKSKPSMRMTRVSFTSEHNFIKKTKILWDATKKDGNKENCG